MDGMVGLPAVPSRPVPNTLDETTVTAPWQVKVHESLKASGIRTVVYVPDEVQATVDGACALAFSTERPVALILDALLTGGKKGLPGYGDEDQAATASRAPGGHGAAAPAHGAQSLVSAGEARREGVMHRQEC